MSEDSRHFNAEFSESIATWRLPLDMYLPDGRALGYAVSILHAECMRKHGVVEQAFNPADYQSARFNDVGRSVLAEKDVSKYGYHGPPSKLDPSDRKRPSLTDDQAKDDSACLRKAYARLQINMDTIEFVQSLAGKAWDAAHANHGVREAVDGWRRCMRPLGIGDLPDNPESMPTDSQRKRFSSGLSAANGTSAAEVGRLEIREAVFDMGCRKSSGWLKKFYATEIRQQVSRIVEHKDKLEIALRVNVVMQREIDNVIEEYEQRIAAAEPK